MEYLGLFAEAAVRGYAHAEAAEALREALRHVEGLPPDLRDRQACELTLRLVVLALLPRPRSTRASTRSGPWRPARRGSRTRRWPGACTCGSGTPTPMPATATAPPTSIARAIHESSRSGDVATFGKAHYVLAREAFWRGRFAEGAEHGRTAAASLERTDEWWWLGHAHAWIGQNLVNTGDFEEALANVARTKEIGRLRDDPRLQSYAGWEIAWYEATRGNWERAIAEGTESLERSPDPLNSAYSMFALGFSYREKGDHAQAISLLQVRDPAAHGVRLRPPRRVAHRLAERRPALVGRPGDRHRDRPAAPLGLSEQVGYPWALAVAQPGARPREPGDRRRSPPRADRLEEARSAFRRMGCRFELAVTHMDLARLEHASGEASATRAEMDAARVLLSELDAPIYSARADRARRRAGGRPASLVRLKGAGTPVRGRLRHHAPPPAPIDPCAQPFGDTATFTVPSCRVAIVA